MLDLLPTLTADIKMATAPDSRGKRYQAIEISADFHTGINALSCILKQSITTVMDGFDQYSPEEKIEEL